jgi:glycerol-3-phosphate cytidylyltransferase
MRVGITFGSYDLLHIGHLNILSRSKSLCEYLVVGVSSDALNLSKKGVSTIYSQSERMKIVSSLRMVDYVFLEESLEKKLDYIKQFHADVLIMGDDWTGKFDFCNGVCDVIYLPRTPNVSTTQIVAEIFSRH